MHDQSSSCKSFSLHLFVYRHYAHCAYPLALWGTHQTGDSEGGELKARLTDLLLLGVQVCDRSRGGIMRTF